MNKLQSFIATVAAIGSVKRRGVSGLADYGGTIDGVGEIIHKSGPRKGKKTKFELSGQAGTRR